MFPMAFIFFFVFILLLQRSLEADGKESDSLGFGGLEAVYLYDYVLG